MYEILLTTIPTSVATVFSWLLARKKYRSAVKESEIENVRKVVNIWKTLAYDLKKEVMELRTEVDSLRAELHEKDEKRGSKNICNHTDSSSDNTVHR